MKKPAFFIATILCLSGCASNVINDVNHYKHEISSSEHSISILKLRISKENENISTYKSNISKLNKSMQDKKTKIGKAKSEVIKSRSYLSSGSDFFINGQCVKPGLGPKPKPYCESESEAKEHALAYCSMSAGCHVAMVLAGDELDTFSKRFLASEACLRSVHELRNESYSLSSTALNVLEALSDTGCSNEDSNFLSFAVKGVGCFMSASIKAEKIQSYMNCTKNKSKSCYSSYKNWRNQPERRRLECLSNVKNIDKNKEYIFKHKKEISIIKKSIIENKNNIEASLKSIALSKQELKKQENRNEEYARLLAEKKKTLAYKLYVK